MLAKISMVASFGNANASVAKSLLLFATSLRAVILQAVVALAKRDVEKAP
jgi:hypothetical protein